MEKMNLFKRLPCDNYRAINAEILNYLSSTGLIDQAISFWNPINLVELFRATPLFVHWTKENNLKLQSVAMTVARDINPLRIHCDTPPARYKLSWPILNTENTFNRWYRSVVPTPQTVINSLGGTAYIDVSELKEIGRMQVNHPSIIDAGIPHDVLFESPVVFPRVGLQCQLFNEPESL